MNPLIVGMRYGTNLVAMVARQQGYLAATAVGSRFVITEIGKLPKAVHLVWQARRHPERVRQRPTRYSDAIVASVEALDVELKPYNVDAGAFRAHVAACGYPRNYAAGPVEEGGVREKKLLEYFVSLDLLAVQATDVVIDVASEWSIFPEVLRQLTGATVYRQDLIYPPGINGHRIGGSAAAMPIAGEFADKLVLHNAFEHFEGTADTDFIIEAWRVLKPGGKICILPLFMADRHTILTDPLVDCRGTVWDEEARVVEIPWCHHRFGRFYDSHSLQHRVLAPARYAGFNATIYHLLNVRQVVPQSRMHFALVMHKPGAPLDRGAVGE